MTVAGAVVNAALVSAVFVVTGSSVFGELSLVTANWVVETFCVVTGAFVDAELVLTSLVVTENCVFDELSSVIVAEDFVVGTCIIVIGTEVARKVF